MQSLLTARLLEFLTVVCKDSVVGSNHLPAVISSVYSSFSRELDTVQFTVEFTCFCTLLKSKLHLLIYNWQGCDIEKDSIVLNSGEHIGPAEIGLLATVGVTTVKVNNTCS